MTLNSSQIIFGGVERHTIELANHISRKGIETHLVTANPISKDIRHQKCDSIASTISIPGYSLLPISKKRLILPIFDVLVQKKLKKRGISILHSQNFDGIPNLMRHTFTKSVVTIHTSPMQRLARAKMNNRILGTAITSIENMKCRRFHSDAYICVSESLGEDLDHVYGINANVIPTGVSNANKINSQRAKEMIGIENWGKTILFLSRITKEKGPHRLLDILEKDPSLNLLIAGTGDFSGELQNMIGKKNLNDRVRMLGFVKPEDISAVFSAADCFAFPSRQIEGLPAVVLEALSYGLPCYVSNPEHVPTYLRHRIASGDIIEGIEKVLSMRKEHVDVPTWEEVALRTIRVYDSIL